MILAAALLVLQVQVNEPARQEILCPYYPFVDPPWRKYTCAILSRLGEPMDRPEWNYKKGFSIPNEGGNAEPREVGSIVPGREPESVGEVQGLSMSGSNAPEHQTSPRSTGGAS